MKNACAQRAQIFQDRAGAGGQGSSGRPQRWTRSEPATAETDTIRAGAGETCEIRAGGPGDGQEPSRRPRRRTRAERVGAETDKSHVSPTTRATPGTGLRDAAARGQQNGAAEVIWCGR